MVLKHQIQKILTITIILQLLLSFIAPGLARAAEVPSSPLVLRQAGEAPAAPEADTTLLVNILSSPYATLDSNDPGGLLSPNVFIVEGQVMNMGTSPAVNVVVTVNYNDPVNNWILLDGEDPVRTIDTLGTGESQYVYWLATYSTTIGATYTYSISAVAENAPLVSTSTNFYGNPQPGKTVQTRSTLSTGNSAVDAAFTIQIGVAFTMTVSYDMGNSPLTSSFSPIGNPDFNAASYYMSDVSIRFYNNAGTWETTIDDRVFFNTINSEADNADVTYVFTARAPQYTHLCPYNAVRFTSTTKYDQFYCDFADGTDIPIDGTAKLTMDKQVSSATVQQGEILTYTIYYENVGTLPLTYSWIWDDIDTSLASIITSTISPSPDPTQTTASRVAWFLDTIPPGDSGVLTFSVLVDGDGQDIPDGTLLDNIANYGINKEGFPTYIAITDTATTEILAPTISVSKTDGQTAAEPGDPLTYQIQVTNSGSVAAEGFVITEVLPADIALSGTPTPAPDIQDGQTLVWTNLGPLAPYGGSVTITIPTTVNIRTPDGTVLTNQMQAQYTNPAGYIFDPAGTSDTTLVNGPVLSISKSAFPNPVLTGTPLLYTLSYANTGPGEATNVVITDVVPLSTTYNSCSGATCSMSGGMVTWNVGTVAAYSSGTVQFTVTVDGFLPSGSFITNDDYGILSDQTEFLAGTADQTTVNVNAANITGFTFIDSNGNGFFDAGENWLTGVPVTLTQATVPVTVTDASGYYAFSVEVPGPIEVTAALPAGYFRTTPENVILESILGYTQTVNFGYASTAEPFGVIYGTVYQDNDTDGTQSLGDYGLPGVTISSSGSITTPVTTNELGQYTLRYDTAGTKTVVETNPLLYVSTTPDSVQANVVLGSSGTSPVDFGDFLGIKITGMVFKDANVNGNKDIGEVGVSGVLISTGSQSFTTGSSGVYTFYVAVPTSDPLDIHETDPAGYISINAIPGTGMTKVDINTLRISSPLSGTVYADGDFADVLASEIITITGQVWDDNGAGTGGVGGDGLPNGSEPGLPGALVTLSSGLSQLSGPDGSFTLYAPPGQLITITQTNPPGYLSTGALPGTNASVVDFDHITVIDTLSGGQSSLDNLFGDVLIASGLSLTKQAEDVDGSPLLVGDTVRYTLQASNSGPNPAFNVTVTDLLPAGVTFVDMLPTLGTVSGPNPVLWSLPILAPATSETLWITVTIDLDQSGQSITNTGSLTSSNIIAPPLNPPAVCPDGSLPVDDICPVTPVDQSDLLVTKTASPVQVSAGDPLTYTITITNLGPSSASQVLVTDTLPAQVTFLSASASQGSYNDLTGLWTVNSLSAGSVATLDIFVTVNPDASGSLVNTAQASSEDYDPDPDNSSSTVETPLGALADLTISKSDNPDPVAAGGILTYTLSFANIGPSDAQALLITDVLPLDVTFLGVVSQPAFLSGPAQSDQSLVWSAASLPAGGSGSIVFTVQVHPTASGTLQNQALLSSETPEADPTSNADIESTSIGAPGLATIYGWVYDDFNGNGMRNAGEPGLPGVLVTLDSTLTAITDADGLYYFITSLSGLHSLVETDPAGYFSTTPNDVHVNVILGNGYQVDFGDAADTSSFATIYGTVFEDLDGDGNWDIDEPGIPGVAITLDGTIPTTTDQYGSYSYRVNLPGVHTVVETDPAGYFSTTPNEVHVLVEFGSGYRVDFGDALNSSELASIFGTVFEDIDADGIWDAEEIGLAGVTLTLDGSTTTTTNQYGYYTFVVTGAGQHTIVETDPDGYISTTPNEVQVEVVLGDGYQVDFGDMLLCTCPPDAFEDDDTNATAHSIQVGPDGRQTRDFCDDSTDWISFNVQAGGLYTITTSAWGQRADTFLALYDTDGQTLLAANDDYQEAPDYSSQIVWQAPTTGVYYIQVTNRDGLTCCNTDYDIWVEATVHEFIGQFLPVVVKDFLGVLGQPEQPVMPAPEGVISHMCPDAYELDDSWELAQPILPNVLQIHSFDSNPTFYAADKDVVYFSMHQGDVVTFTVVTLTNTNTLLELFDKYGNALNVTGTTQLVWEAPAPGTYILSVSPQTQNYGCVDTSGYELLMELHQPIRFVIPLLHK